MSPAVQRLVRSAGAALLVAPVRVLAVLGPDPSLFGAVGAAHVLGARQVVQGTAL